MNEQTFILLRYAATCVGCGSLLPPRSEARWDRAAREATCRACVESRVVTTDEVNPGPLSLASEPAPSLPSAARPAAPPVEGAPAEHGEIERGTPGASVARQFKRRHDRRENQVRDQWGRFGGIYLALTDDPRSTRAWATGSHGERVLGEALAQLDNGATIIVLHDRRIPASRANIDHIAITRNGVHVIDAKRYNGKVQQIDRGGWFSTDTRLYVGRRDCTSLLAGMAKQVEAIRGVLGQVVVDEFALRIRPVLCFVDAEWPLFAKPFELEGVWVGWGRALAERLSAPGTLEPEHVQLLAGQLARGLRPA